MKSNGLFHGCTYGALRGFVSLREQIAFLENFFPSMGEA